MNNALSLSLKTKKKFSVPSFADLLKQSLEGNILSNFVYIRLLIEANGDDNEKTEADVAMKRGRGRGRKDVLMMG